ncbi:serine/arginine-rich splicing factor RS41-like isoform X1 [Amaranthus tricolor]|uniref:serine/arginine-rich splicing factor RS41-like isoform X1 n=2 Tax=Amaranthus tricolor TaxID=29722 RepID=UPI00258B713A|nr:serine/arginine-rich splicing factor RS41-like isoform X1 [Amaranthus tricolor]
MRPIFCGNFDFEARSSDLERLFRRYGKVDRVDMKSGFAFVYMDDERDAEYAIRALDRSEYGRKGRRLRVEWTKHERGGRKPVSSRRPPNTRPSKTLFVINFPYDTKTRDLERHFEPYGKILNVRIRRNFAFVQYESQEDATKALDATNLSKLFDRVISVEYASRDDDDNRRGGYSPERRGRDRSPDRRRRSPSPYRRERGSPDYGTGSSPAPYRRERGSPDYGNGTSHSPRRIQRSPDYGNVPNHSPHRVQRSPDYGNGSSRSPRRVQGSPEYGNGPSRSPRRVEKSPEYGVRSSRSPRRVHRSSEYVRDRSRSASPRPEQRRSPGFRDRSRSPRGGDRNGNGYGRRPSLSPYPEEGAISDDAREPRSPINKTSLRDSPIGEYGSPVNRYRSPSPPGRERSQS